MASMKKLNIFNSFLLLLLFPAAMAELHRLEHPVNTDGSISFLVVGDWGRRGTFNQSQVAQQMGIIGEKLNIDFVVSTGDNFYDDGLTGVDDPAFEESFTYMGIIGEKLNIDFVVSTGDNFYDDGLTGVDDPAFEESFTNVYTAPSLQKKWYNVLGNHDYRGDALAQLSPILKQKDNRWICMRSYIVNTDVAEFFFVDTTPFQDMYFTTPKDHTYDWRNVMPRKDYLSLVLKDLDSALRESSAKWKIVVGHHTIKSAGHHGSSEELGVHILPILQANNVDFYLNGHDHCLEHISSSDSPLQFLTSGGGSKSWRGDMNWWNPKEMKFYYDGQGFMAMQITQTQVWIQFFDIFGNILHKWSASKNLVSIM